jgi:hypothetical protein
MVFESATASSFQILTSRLRIGLCSGRRKGTSLVSFLLKVHTRLGVGKEEGNKSCRKAVSYGTGRTKKVRRKWLRKLSKEGRKKTRQEDTRGQIKKE